MADLFSFAYEDKYQEYEQPHGYCPKCGLDHITYGDPLATLDGILPHGQMIIRRKERANEKLSSAFGEIENTEIVRWYIFDESMVYRHCDICGHHWCYLMHERPKID